MLDTTFASSSGRAILSDSNGADPADTNGQETAPAATTLRDLARLVKAASQNKTLSSALTRRNEYLVLPGPTVISLHHQLETLWTLSEDASQARFSATRQRSDGDIRHGEWDLGHYIVHGGRATEAIDDNVKLYNAVGNRLKSQPSSRRATISSAAGTNGRWRGFWPGLPENDYLCAAKRPGLPGQRCPVPVFWSFTRPILNGAVIGQAIFKLLDGTTIAVDVGPDPRSSPASP